MKIFALHILFDAIVFAGLGIAFLSASEKKDKRQACIGVAVAATGTMLRSMIDLSLTARIATGVVYIIFLIAIRIFYRKF